MEAALKVFEEISQLFGSGPTDQQILNFRPSADVAQRASKLLSLNRTSQMDGDPVAVRVFRAFRDCGPAKGNIERCFGFNYGFLPPTASLTPPGPRAFQPASVARQVDGDEAPAPRGLEKPAVLEGGRGG